jgi:hypothetical protein
MPKFAKEHQGSQFNNTNFDYTMRHADPVSAASSRDLAECGVNSRAIKPACSVAAIVKTQEWDSGGWFEWHQHWDKEWPQFNDGHWS